MSGTSLTEAKCDVRQDTPAMGLEDRILHQRLALAQKRMGPRGIQMSSLQIQAKIEWQKWGAAWGKFTQCSGCKRYVYCRGPRQNKMLCLDCFDVGEVKR